MNLPEPAQRRKRHPAVPKKSQDSFLEALAAGWSITHAANRVSVRKQRLYELRETDEAFASAWAEALEEGTQRIEDEMLRRAVDGYDEVTYNASDEVVRRVHRYDSALLQQLHKVRRPDLYREKVEISGPDGGPVEMAAGYQPATLADMVGLAGELGVLDQLGYTRNGEIAGELVAETEEAA